MTAQKIRLQKYLSQAGIASRREGEKLILAGAVTVNGRTATELGVKIDPAKDVIAVKRRVVLPGKKVSVMLNKPAGYLCSLKDRFGRPLVTDLITGIPERLYPVGRLDLDSEGLLLLTNDGALCHLLTHPRHQVEKTYRVYLRSPITEKQKRRLESGVVLDAQTVSAPARVNVLRSDRCLAEVRIREGKKRQVKKMLLSVGNRVIRLRRTEFGPLKLGTLTRGEWRELTAREIEALKTTAKSA